MATRWTDDELQYLTNNCGIVCNRKIAKKLGRTHKAIQVKLHKLGISVFSNFYTARLLAQQLGKTHRTIMNWYRRGYLTGELAEFGRGYLKTPMIFLEEDIVIFLQKHYQLVKCENIEHPYFRNIVKECYLNGGNG